MHSVLVTGASGFIGRALSKKFATFGHRVTGTSYDNATTTNLRCNIADRSAVDELVREVNPDVIVHCAALSTVSVVNTLDYYRINLLGTENLLKAASRLGRQTRFLFLSTAGVYGNQNCDVLSEDLRPSPVHHYGMSKLNCEFLFPLMSKHVNYTIIRPFNVVGPGQNPSFIFPKLVRHFAEKRSTIELGNIDVIRDYIELNQAVSSIERLIACEAAFGETVNLCTGRGTSIRELIDTLAEITGRSITIVRSEALARSNEVWRLLGDCTKLNRLLPGRPEPTPLREVLENMLDEFKLASDGPDPRLT